MHADITTALGLHQAGRLNEAERRYREILSRQPDHPEVMHFLGVVVAQLGRDEESVELLQRAAELRPHSAEVFQNLGEAYRVVGRIDEAKTAIRTAIQLKPAFARSHFSLGSLLDSSGEQADAIACYEEAVRLNPNYTEAWSNLGSVLREKIRLPESLDCLKRAVTLAPQSSIVHNSLACTLAALERLDEAVDHFRQALQLNSDFAEADFNLANTFRKLWRMEEAVESYRNAIQKRPDYFTAWNNLARTHQDLGNVAEAAECYHRALQIQPNDTIRYIAGTILPILYESADDIRQWRRRFVQQISDMLAEGVQLNPIQEVVPPAFYLAYQGLDDKAIHESIAQLCRGGAMTGGNRTPRTIGRQEKIRIGFISANFKWHTVGILWKGLIANLSRNRFSVTVLSLRMPPPGDDVAQEIQQSVDRYIPLPENLKLARQIVDDESFDILYFPDIGMDAGTYALALSRLAPVQCVSWGHPSTTGLPNMDYFVSSDLLESEGAETHYTERLVRMKTLGLYVDRSPRLAATADRSTFGVPPNKHAYGCLQSLFKFHPDFDRLLAGILRDDPEGVLILAGGHSVHWNDLLLDRFRRTMPDLVDRIQFVPRQSYENYLRLASLMDVLLVPPQFGGGRTSYDALSLGIPIVTLPTDQLRGRITYGLYRAMEMTDCVATSEEDYVRLSVQLGTNAGFRAEMSRKILDTCGRLFNDVSAVRELEDFLEQAVRHSD